MGDPSIRVHNASVKFSLQLADMLSFDNPENPLPDGFGYRFEFPDAAVEGSLRMNRYRDTCVILICVQNMRSDKIHSMILSPPEASKEEVIRWLGDENTWPLIEEKWQELCRDAIDGQEE